VLAVSEIIDEAKTIAKKYGAKGIFLGIKDDKLIEVLGFLNFNKEYSAVRMILEDIEVKGIPLNLRILLEANKKDYFMVYNDAFKEVPNGATVTESEVEQYIKEQDENNCYYLAEMDDKNIGFIQFKIENGMGEFDLGLISEVRGKSYGKRLLETAINFLNSKEVTDISLTVITSNTIAYEMYKKRGFKEVNLISDWFLLEAVSK